MWTEISGLLSELGDHLLGSKVGLSLLAKGLHGVANFLEQEADALDAQNNPTPAPAPTDDSDTTVQAMSANVSPFRTIGRE